MKTAPSISPKTHWYLRMKQGKEARVDYTERLWRPGETIGLVGVFWGAWRIGDLLPDGCRLTDGWTPEIDHGKFTVAHLDAAHREANAFLDGMNKAKGLNPGGVTEGGLTVSRAFLDVQNRPNGPVVKEGDGVVVSYKDKQNEIWLARGVVGAGFHDHPTDVPPCDQKFPNGTIREFFKCRPVLNKREFRLSELPSAFRLIRGTGQGTLQRISAYKALSDLLFCHDSSEEIRAAISDRPAIEILSLLSDKQWEMVCAEWLRDQHPNMRLLLGVGGTLERLDIVAVVNGVERLYAQCKNSSAEPAEGLPALVADLVAETTATYRYLFVRGLRETVPIVKDSVKIISGPVIADWLSQLENAAYRVALTSL